MTSTHAPDTLAVAIQTRADVLGLSDVDRQALLGWLADARPPRVMPAEARRRRRRALLVASGAAVFLVPWLIFLAATLPDRHRAHEWRLAWVGFDVALMLAFAATAWYGWRGRQIVVTAFVVTATLLLCDAWFDVLLSIGGPEQRSAIFTALIGEVPLALFLLSIYHRLLRALTTQIWSDSGRHDSPPPLRRLPLLLRAATPHEVRLHWRAASDAA